MKIYICQQIIPTKDIREFKQVCKKFDSNVIPHRGDRISDSFFKEPYDYEVIECTIDYQNNECTVFIEPIKVENASEVKEQIKIAELHGWEE